MFNNMENRDLFFEEEKKEEKDNKKSIWIILLYIILIMCLMFAVIITSASFLNATIKKNEPIIDDGGDTTPDTGDDEINVDEIPSDSGDNDSTTSHPSTGTGENKGDGTTIVADDIDITFTEQDDSKIRMNYAYPISEEKALENDNTIKFNITSNKGNANYKITLQDIKDEELENAYNNRRIDHKYLRYYLKNLNTNEEYRGLLSDLDNNSYICSGTINKGEKINYTIAVWIDKDAGNEVQNSFYIGELVVDVEGE